MCMFKCMEMGVYPNIYHGYINIMIYGHHPE